MLKYCIGSTFYLDGTDCITGTEREAGIDWIGREHTAFAGTQAVNFSFWRSTKLLPISTAKGPSTDLVF